MDKKIIGLVGAMATVSAAAVSAPSSADAMAVSSYADLLKPIPNAVETLKATGAVAQSDDQAKVELAQYYYHHHHHHHFFHRRYYHHHHHHHFFRRHFFHHHHHHHHFGF